jgi:microcystin-dependent protein
MTFKHTWRRILIAAAASTVAVSISLPVHGEPFIGEIRWVGSNFCPQGWAAADGQSLPIADNEALFSLIGTTFGGDGQTTFALPDLRGRGSVHSGNGIVQGQTSGLEQRTLAASQLPSHSHAATTDLAGVAVSSVLYGSAAAATTDSPGGAAVAVTKRQAPIYAAGTPDQAMADGSVLSTAVGGRATTTLEATDSGTAAVPVRDPYLGMKACISLFGVYPSRD